MLLLALICFVAFLQHGQQHLPELLSVAAFFKMSLVPFGKRDHGNRVMKMKMGLT